MTPFAAKLQSGQQFLGLGLSKEDADELVAGGHVVIDLATIGVGLWIKDTDGKRSFIQPRDSKILVMLGDKKEHISELLKVDLSTL